MNCPGHRWHGPMVYRPPCVCEDPEDAGWVCWIDGTFIPDWAPPDPPLDPVPASPKWPAGGGNAPHTNTHATGGNL